MITKRYLVFAVILVSLARTGFTLTLEQSRQFREKDYILKEGVTIEYRGEEQELFFVDKGFPYHYSRIQQEVDGDLFRWVELGEMKREKYVRYLAKARDSIPEIIVKERRSDSYPGKTSPDTVCNLLYDRQTGKPRNVYLVDFETGNFDPVIEQAAKDLSEELQLSVTSEQAVLFFYNRCSEERFPFEQVKQKVETPTREIMKVAPEEGKITGQYAAAREAEQLLHEEKPALNVTKASPGKDTNNADESAGDESTVNEGVKSVGVPAQDEADYCAEINDDVYRIADDTSRAERLASFVSQLELVYSWDWGADSYSRLISLFNIAYPLYVHYEELGENLKKRFARVMSGTYEISDEFYEQLPCQERIAMNTLFNKVLGKTR